MFLKWLQEKKESNVLKKHISCECKCKFDSRKCKSNQKWNNDKCRCEFGKRNIFKKDRNWSPTEHSCKNGEYLASIIDDSVIMCAEIIEETKTISTNLNEKRETCKTQNFFILLDF